MTYQPRTPVENPYCANQFADGAPLEPVTWATDCGLCPDCGRFVNTRKNGTAKIHRVYGKGDMSRRIAAWKRGESI